MNRLTEPTEKKKSHSGLVGPLLNLVPRVVNIVRPRGQVYLACCYSFIETIQRLLRPSNLAAAEKERNKQILYLHIHPQASSFVVVGSVTLPTVMISMFIKKEQMELRKIHTRSTGLFK